MIKMQPKRKSLPHNVYAWSKTVLTHILDVYIKQEYGQMGHPLAIGIVF